MPFDFSLENRNLYDYPAYRAMLDALMAEGKTTGSDHSEAMMEYAKMNVVRMNRWDKTAQLTEEVKSKLTQAPKQIWIVLSEGWCGDAAQNLPIIYKMAEENDAIDLQILLRDDNLDIMDAYLTNGGRSIPKLIALNENNEVLFTWGPRPQKMQETVVAIKKEGGDYATEIHKMYARDKSISLQEEFSKLLS